MIVDIMADSYIIPEIEIILQNPEKVIHSAL